MAEKFYKKCVQNYHDVLLDVTGDKSVIEVPELATYCEQVCVSLIDDMNLGMKYMHDQFQYRFVLVAMSVQLGIVHAAWFKENPDCFDDNIKKLNWNNLDNIAYLVFSTHMKVGRDTISRCFSWVFDEWNNVINPKWTLEKNRDDILDSYKAAYQLGVSWYMQKC